MSKKDKLLTLSSGKKFVIIEECEYNNENYYFAIEVINDETTNNYKIFTIRTSETGKEIIKEIKDNEIIKSVCKILDSKLI